MMVRLKNQTLSLVVDFKNRLVFGSTVLSVSLSIPSSLGQVIQTPPPSDISTSGLSVFLQCPTPDLCNISAVEVGGLPATYQWHAQPQVRHEQLITIHKRKENERS